MERLLNFAVLLLLHTFLPCCLAQPANRTLGWPCLNEEDRVPSSQIRNLTFPNGESAPVGLAYGAEHGSWLISTIARIILVERLGYNTFLERFIAQSELYYRTAGCMCENVCALPNCSNVPDTPTLQYLMLGWQNPMEDREKVMEDVNRELVLDHIGVQGYRGFYGLHVPGAVRSYAEEAMGVHLEYYKAYRDPNVSQFFDDLESVNVPNLRHCNITQFQRPSLLADLVRIFGQEAVGSVTLPDGTEHLPCYQGSWWLAPACRDNPNSCIPVTTSGGGQGFAEIASKAIAHNMPVAVAAVRRYLTYISTARRHIYFGWYPSIEMAVQNGSAIIFPPHDSYMWSTGDQRSAGVDQLIQTYANPKVSLTPEGRYVSRFLANAKLGRGQMDETVDTYWERTGQQVGERIETLAVLGCDWVHEHKSVWEEWIPKRTLCDLGSGLISDPADRFSYVTDESQATECAYCSAGRYSVPMVLSDGAKSYVCSPCPVGKEQATSAEASCTLCPVGKHKNQEGTDPCQDCPAGKHQDAHGQPECKQCPPGRSTGLFGQPECRECGPAEFAAEAGQENCTLCPQGTFTSNFSSVICTPCSSVILGSTSPRASPTADECVCPEGSFMKASGCVPCIEGLLCPQGRGVPQQLGGYWTDVSDPQVVESREYVVYRCRAPNECPAGSLGSCAAGREGIACNNCEDFHYPEGSGSCYRCDGTSLVPAVTSIVLIPPILLGLLYFMQTRVKKQHLTIVTAVTVSGQVVYAVQLLAAMDQINVELPEPIASILKWLGPLILDLDMFRIPCLFGADRPLINFVLLLLVLPVFTLMLTSLWWAGRFFGKPVSFDHLFNLNGNIAYITFISLVIAIMLPFQCRSNPGGFTSMKTDPGLKCFEHEEHIILVIFSVLGTLFYPITIAVWMTYVTWKFRTWVHAPDGIRKITTRYRFLFSRFKPERYYFGIIFMFRNLTLAATPVFLVEFPTIQILAMTTFLIAGTTCQAACWPWRTEAANRCDLVLSCMLLLLVAGIGTLVKGEERSVEEMLGKLLTVVVVSGILVALLTVAWALHRRCRPLKMYDIFLCHHKAGAGSQCRLIKIMVESASSAAVFLDSDHLDNLDMLFDTVRTEVNHFVVVLSQNVLSRHWCAGEIATAKENRVHMMPLLCDGFSPPGPADVQRIVESWTEDEVSTLLAFGISDTDVTEAYTYLLNLPMLSMPLFQGLYQKEKALKELRQQIQAFPITQLLSENSSRKPVILVAGLVSDAEALAACEIMQLLLQRRLEVEVSVVHDHLEAEAYKSNAIIFLVLLSRGLLQDPVFGRIVSTLFSSEGAPHILTAIADPGFHFPSSDFLLEVEEFGLGVQGLGPEEGSVLASTYHTMLTVLARPFTPLASRGAIAEQVADVASRAKPLLQGERERVRPAASWATHKSSRASFSTARTRSTRTLSGTTVPTPSNFEETRHVGADTPMVDAEDAPGFEKEESSLSDLEWI